MINKKIKKVGILGTDATIKNKVYERELLKNNLEVVYPDEFFQKEVMSIIYDEIKKIGKAGRDFATENYTPLPTAKRLLNMITQY